MKPLAGRLMEYVYVISRGDGFHKIGVTCDVHQRRETLSKIYRKSAGPFKIVKSFYLGMRAPLIEKVAHYQMTSRGYEMHPLEWFEASARTCTSAVRRAIKLIDDIGPDGWAKQRIARRKKLLDEQWAQRADAFDVWLADQGAETQRLPLIEQVEVYTKATNGF